jgi:hypothetical protein
VRRQGQVSWPFVFAICEVFVHVHKFSVVGEGDPELVVQLHDSIAPVSMQLVHEDA